MAAMPLPLARAPPLPCEQPPARRHLLAATGAAAQLIVNDLCTPLPWLVHAGRCRALPTVAMRTGIAGALWVALIVLRALVRIRRTHVYAVSGFVLALQGVRRPKSARAHRSCT